MTLLGNYIELKIKYYSIFREGNLVDRGKCVEVVIRGSVERGGHNMEERR